MDDAWLCTLMGSKGDRYVCDGEVGRCFIKQMGVRAGWVRWWAVEKRSKGVQRGGQEDPSRAWV